MDLENKFPHMTDANKHIYDEFKEEYINGRKQAKEEVKKMCEEFRNNNQQTRSQQQNQIT